MSAPAWRTVDNIEPCGQLSMINNHLLHGRSRRPRRRNAASTIPTPRRDGYRRSVEIDVLGPPYERHTIDLGTDDEGPVVATLVRRRADDADAARGALRPRLRGLLLPDPPGRLLRRARLGLLRARPAQVRPQPAARTRRRTSAAASPSTTRSSTRRPGSSARTTATTDARRRPLHRRPDHVAVGALAPAARASSTGCSSTARSSTSTRPGDARAGAWPRWSTDRAGASRTGSCPSLGARPVRPEPAQRPPWRVDVRPGLEAARAASRCVPAGWARSAAASGRLRAGPGHRRAGAGRRARPAPSAASAWTRTHR